MKEKIDHLGRSRRGKSSVYRLPSPPSHDPCYSRLGSSVLGLTYPSAAVDDDCTSASDSVLVSDADDMFDSDADSDSPYLVSRLPLPPAKQSRQHILSFLPEVDSIESTEISLEEIFGRALHTLNNAVDSIDRNVSKKTKELVGIVGNAAQNKESTEDLIKVVIATLNLFTGKLFWGEYSNLADLIESRSSVIMKQLSRAMCDLSAAMDEEDVPFGTPYIYVKELSFRVKPIDNALKKLENFSISPLRSELHHYSEKELRLMCSWVMNSLARALYEAPCPHFITVVQSAEKLLDSLFTRFILSQDKQSMISLMEISIATINHLNGYTSSEEYKQLANEMQRHSALTLRELGGLMLALGGVILAIGAVVGLGLTGIPVAGVCVATAGLALTSVSASFFSKKSIKEEVVESMEELRNSLDL